MDRLSKLSPNDTTYYNMPLEEGLIDDGDGRLCIQESDTLYNVSSFFLLCMLCGIPPFHRDASQLFLPASRTLHNQLAQNDLVSDDKINSEQTGRRLDVLGTGLAAAE